MSTITPEQEQAIRDYFNGPSHNIPVGIGTREEACSIAGINLALSGQLTDTIPECMSQVIGRWIIGVQDAMPDDMRNSVVWRQLLPLAAGTGRDYEHARLNLILDWMWGTVLPSLQPIATAQGFGAEWITMCTSRTRAAAAAAAAEAAAEAAAAEAEAEAWATFDPSGLLARLIAIGDAE